VNNTLYIIWTRKNEIGIPVIDEQHRGIISIINSLHYFIQNCHSEKIIKPTMIMLVQYTIVHFQTEEALMKEAGYPALDKHMAMHKILAEKTRELTIEVHKTKDSDKILQFLKRWWLTHINNEDRKYIPYLKQG
jgi:hemerythrin-like metal-binding protein